MKRKAYLNRNEKTTVQVIAAFVAYLDDLIRTLEGLKNPPKPSIKWAKMSRSFALKLMDEYMLPLDEDERLKIITECRKMEISARYKDEALRQYEAVAKLDSYTHVPTEEFLQLIELCLASCSICDSDSKDCRFRKLFIKYDIEPLNFSVKGCPYRIEGY